VGFCDERIPLIDDWPLWLKLTKQGHKIHFYNQTLVKYRQHNRSITNENQGLFVSDLHRKERLVYRLYVAPNIGLFRKISYHFSYGFNEILYRFFNSKSNRFALWTLCFLRFLKRFFRPKKTKKNPKHIAFFMQDFEMGGVGIVFENYIKILKPLGYEIDVIVAHDRGVLRERFEREVRVINLGNIRLRNTIFKLRKQVKNSSASVLISGSDLANFIAVLAMHCLRKSCRLIVTQHGISGNPDDLDIGAKSRFMNLAKRVLYPRASRIVAVSNAVAEDLKNHRLPKDKITTLPNPVFSADIRALAEMPVPSSFPERYILFIGRLVRGKNVGLLLDAFAQIADETLHLVIVGDGYERQRLEQKAEPVSSRVHFLGVVDNPMPLIKHAEIVAIPSLSESFSLVALEAATLGTTIVHTPNPGCLEVLGQNNSYCSTRFDDPKEFAELLKTALDQPVDVSLLKQRADIFDAAQISSQLEMLIQNL
jgi:glycosyltransferase involved in cell wall biosynthesis